MSRNLVETLMGAVVLVVAGMFLVFAYSSANLRPIHGYEVIARFERIDGVNVGADVKMSGIKVGTVLDQQLDDKTYQAVVRMSIAVNIKLPTDSVAQVATEGLLGGTFIALVPGGEDAIIPAGGEIKYTQSPVNLVQLLGKFIFDSADKAGDQPKPAQPK